MNKQEFLFRELCREVVVRGIETDRFTKLWLETGVMLDGSEIEIANRILSQSEHLSRFFRTAPTH